MLISVASWLIGAWVVGILGACINLGLLNRESCRLSNKAKHKREMFWLRVVGLVNLMMILACALMALSLILSLLPERQEL